MRFCWVWEKNKENPEEKFESFCHGGEQRVKLSEQEGVQVLSYGQWVSLRCENIRNFLLGHILFFSWLKNGKKERERERERFWFVW